MPSILPEIQVGPLAGVSLWLFVIGAVALWYITMTTGGFIAGIVLWIPAVILLYWFLSRISRKGRGAV